MAHGRIIQSYILIQGLDGRDLLPALPPRIPPHLFPSATPPTLLVSGPSTPLPHSLYCPPISLADAPTVTPLHSLHFNPSTPSHRSTSPHLVFSNPRAPFCSLTSLPPDPSTSLHPPPRSLHLLPSTSLP